MLQAGLSRLSQNLGAHISLRGSRSCPFSGVIMAYVRMLRRHPLSRQAPSQFSRPRSFPSSFHSKTSRKRRCFHAHGRMVRPFHSTIPRSLGLKGPRGSWKRRGRNGRPSRALGASWTAKWTTGSGRSTVDPLSAGSDPGSNCSDLGRRGLLRGSNCAEVG